MRWHFWQSQSATCPQCLKHSFCRRVRNSSASTHCKSSTGWITCPRAGENSGTDDWEKAVAAGETEKSRAAWQAEKASLRMWQAVVARSENRRHVFRVTAASPEDAKDALIAAARTYNWDAGGSEPSVKDELFNVRPLPDEDEELSL